jgi:hypothetical protein
MLGHPWREVRPPQHGCTLPYVPSSVNSGVLISAKIRRN